jgi:N6-adenosine-specific RNA methylase IME4
MNEIILYDKPNLPEEWNYDESVNKVEPLVYKWKYLSLEMMTELWIAREMLSRVGNPDFTIGTNVPIGKTWAQYCRDIKLEKRTANRWLKLFFQLETEAKEKENLLLPVEGKWAAIVIDPPWKYGTKYDEDTRRVASPYDEIPLEELYKFKIPADDNSSLWLWTTHKFINESFDLMENWGFEYKISIAWNKVKMGMGRWLRCQVEFCLLGIRGKPNWNLTNERDILEEKRREHSRKPDGFYELVEDITPGPLDDTYYCDIFSREKRKGWAQIGMEINKF